MTDKGDVIFRLLDAVQFAETSRDAKDKAALRLTLEAIHGIFQCSGAVTLSNVCNALHNKYAKTEQLELVIDILRHMDLIPPPLLGPKDEKPGNPVDEMIQTFLQRLHDLYVCAKIDREALAVMNDMAAMINGASVKLDCDRLLNVIAVHVACNACTLLQMKRMCERMHAYDYK